MGIYETCRGIDESIQSPYMEVFSESNFACQFERQGRDKETTHDDMLVISESRLPQLLEAHPIIVR